MQYDIYNKHQPISDLSANPPLLKPHNNSVTNHVSICKSAFSPLTARIGCSRGRRIGTQLTAKTQPPPEAMVCLQPA